MAIAPAPDTETSRESREAAREERRRHLRVVGPRERPWMQLRLTPRAGIGVTVGLFVALFAVAASHALLIESQGRLDRLDQRVSEEQARYSEVQAEVSTLESPDRIREEVEEEGMVPADEQDYLVQSQPVGPEADPEEQPMSPTSQIDLKPYLDTTP